jgi:hypothetical protein
MVKFKAPRGAGSGGAKGIFKAAESWLRWAERHTKRNIAAPYSTRTWRPKSLLHGKPASFGHATSTDYAENFFAHHPELRGNVWVHHAVEQQALTRYPHALTGAQLHSYENLRGIPNDLNSRVHLSAIRKEWNEFYRNNPHATGADLLRKATEIDNKYGHLFHPRLR